jgi:hypothetical protein
MIQSKTPFRMVQFIKHGVALSVPGNWVTARKRGNIMKNSAKFGMDACGGHDG